MHTGCRYCLLAPITIRTSILPSFEQGKLLQIMYLGINVIVKLLLVENKMELHLLSSLKFLIKKTCIDVQSYCCNRLEKKYCRVWILEKLSIIRQLQLCSNCFQVDCLKDIVLAPKCFGAFLDIILVWMVKKMF